VKKISLSMMCTITAVFCFMKTGTATAQTKQTSEAHLKFVLILTRHGVRSPTWTNERLDEYSREPWPTWQVAPGLLTPHGKVLMTQFGTYYRSLFAGQGLLSASGCTDANEVYLYADTDKRTLDTGRSLADGMLPTCKVDVHSNGEGTQDVLFHPLGKIGKHDSQLAFSAIAGRMGYDPSALLPAYQMPLETMQQVLLACPTPDCAPDNKKSLLAIPPSLAPGVGDHLAEVKGPLSTAATFAENLQLEYLEGMPDNQVGWGRVDEAKIRSLMAIHASGSDLIQRTPYVARVQGSNLLFHMLRTLEQAEQQKVVAGAIGSPQDKVTILVGHDTNISNVAALLDIHWLVNGYQRDDAAPGGALILELWQAAGHDDSVRAYYMVQSPIQMRNALPLSLATPPSRAKVFLPGCSQAGEDASCNWSNFKSLAESVIDKTFAQ
jgi:4-phytase/acid phosphatase